MPSPLAGQVAVTSTPQKLSATAVQVTAFTIKAPASNSQPVYIGPAGITTTTGYPIDPGETVEYERSQQAGQPVYALGPADIYAVGTAPDVVGWFGSPAP